MKSITRLYINIITNDESNSKLRKKFKEYIIALIDKIIRLPSLLITIEN